MPKQLYDITVDTLGLVDKGANGEEFYLVKRNESESLLDRIVNAIKSVMKEVDMKETNAGQPTETEVKEEVAEKAAEEVVEAKVEEKQEEQQVVEAKKTVETEVKETVTETETVKAETEEVETQKSVETDPVAQLLAKVADLEKSTNELKEEVAKAKQRAASAEEAVVEKVFIEKARGYDALPVKPEEMAIHLSRMSKALPEDTVTYLEGVLKAANGLVRDGGLFVEKGTSRIPEIASLTEKARKLSKDEQDFATSLLSLPADVQQQYIDEARQRNRK